jgi:hypothetical protein
MMILFFLGEDFFEPSPIRFPCHLWRWNEIDSIDLAEEFVIVLPKALKNSTFGSTIGYFQEKSKKLSVIFAVSKKKGPFVLDFSVINDTKIE